MSEERRQTGKYDAPHTARTNSEPKHAQQILISRLADVPEILMHFRIIPQ